MHRKRNPSQGLTVASLFAGGGGWEVGAVEAGVRPVWASELQDDIAQYHDAALPGSHVYVGDVRLLDAATVPHCDILCVSPPCQGYSWARTSKQGLEERPDLLVGIEALRFVEHLRPPVVLMENVSGYQKSEVFAQLVAGLKRLGYHVDYKSVLCADYGVPTTRRRLIVRASLAKLPPWPAKTRKPTWDAAMGDLIDGLPAGAALAKWQAKSVALCPPPAGEPLIISGGGGTFCKPTGPTTGRLRDRIKKAWYEPGIPGPTMVASYKNMSGWRVIDEHGGIRRFTAHCAARIQSFPDWYFNALPIKRKGKASDEALAFKIIGNAVPPALARVMIESMLPVLDGPRQRALF